MNSLFPRYNFIPDVDKLVDVLKGKRESKEVLLAELIIDDEILEEYTIKYLKKEWVKYDRKNKDARRKYWDNVLECYKTLGYSGFRVSNALMFNVIMDKAVTSSNETRNWVNHSGQIKDEESFDKYPWPTEDDIDLFDYEYVSSILPDNMGIFACVYGGIFEMLCEYIVGVEELCYMQYDNPELLKRIFDKVGDLLLLAYQKVVKIKGVKALFQGDDMGYTEGLMFSPEFYDEYVLPWHKKLAKIAHDNNIPYFLHSCGNLRGLKEKLFEIDIDAKHSFEDKGWSVIDFYNEHHNKVGVIGGVDVDKLCRMNREDFKKYCINILDNCHKKGRYVFGSGNSIASYVPLENFLYMIELAMNYE